MKFAFIATQKTSMSLARLCSFAGVSISGYYAWKRRPPSRRQLDNMIILAHIRNQFALSRATYGSPRMHVELNEASIEIGRHRTARLTRSNGLMARQKTRFKCTTDSPHGGTVAANVLNQDFTCDRPNQKWGADISYIWTSEGWLYLAIVVDLYSRRIVGWEARDRMKKALAISALNKVITVRQPKPGLIQHSDRGSQYASDAILTRIVKLHFKRPAVTTDSRIAADNLNALPIDAVSHYILKACKAEPRFLETFQKSFKTYEFALRQCKELRLERVIKNHAQMMALIDCLALVIPLDQAIITEAKAAIYAMAVERQDAISADHPLVNEFWEIYDYLENLSDSPLVNHSRSPEKIAINLNEFYALCLHHGQKAIDLDLLRKLLIDSKRHTLIARNEPTRSAIRAGDALKPQIVKCWIFKN